MKISFNEESGKKVMLRGMIGNTPRVVTTKCMEAIFRREDIVYIDRMKNINTCRQGRVPSLLTGYLDNP
jgi:hypothetical protein